MSQGNGNPMSKERMGEIALMVVKTLVVKRKLLDTMDPQEIRRHIGNYAKDLSIDHDEAAQFASIILSDVFNNVLEGISKRKKTIGF